MANEAAAILNWWCHFQPDVPSNQQRGPDERVVVDWGRGLKRCHKRVWMVSFPSGPSGVGVNELRKRLIQSNPGLFQGAVPRTFPPTSSSCLCDLELLRLFQPFQTPPDRPKVTRSRAEIITSPAERSLTAWCTRTGEWACPRAGGRRSQSMTPLSGLGDYSCCLSFRFSPGLVLNLFPQVSGIWRVQRKSVRHHHRLRERRPERREDLHRWHRAQCKHEQWKPEDGWRWKEHLCVCVRPSRRWGLTSWRPTSSTWSHQHWSASGSPEKRPPSPPATMSTGPSR